MNITNDQQEGIIKQAVNSVAVNKPSVDFTSSVMNKIEALQPIVVKPVVSTPLISWKGWLVISGIIVAIFSILLILEPTTSNIDFLYTYFDSFRSISISFPDIAISSIFMMGLCAFIIFFIIEISLISRRFKKV